MKRYFGSLSFYRRALMIGVPVMLQHGMFDVGAYNYRHDGVNGEAAVLCEQLKQPAG